MEMLITLGVDKYGQIYGLNTKVADNERGWDWERNPFGYATSCDVIRPVSRNIMENLQNDADSVRDAWKECVACDATELGLDDWFKERKNDPDVYPRWDGEYWPFKDESFCEEILMDKDNPTIAEFMEKNPGSGPRAFREYIEKMICEKLDVENDIGTWECSGWFPPDEPFAIELGPRWLLDEYYAHLTEKHSKFRENTKEEK